MDIFNWSNGVSSIIFQEGKKILVKITWTDARGEHRDEFVTTIQVAGINSENNPYIIIAAPSAPFTNRLVFYWGYLNTSPNDCCHNFGWHVGNECDDFLFAIGRPKVEISIVTP